MDRSTSARLLALLSATPFVAFANTTLQFGAPSGAGNNSIHANSSLVFNFGITTTGGASNLALSQIGMTVDRGQNSGNLVVEIWSGFGATGTLLSSTTFTPSQFSASGFTSTVLNLSSALSLSAGAYSLRLSSNSASNAAYQIKATPLSLNGAEGVTLTNNLWVQDSNSTGSASTTISPSAGHVLADHRLSTNSVSFGNYRVGSTVSQNVTVTNTAFATSPNVTESLARASSSTDGGATLSGFLPSYVSGNTSTYVTQGSTSQFSVGLDSSIAGVNSGTVSLGFSSVIDGSGSNRAGGPAAVGNQSITVSGTGFRAAEASPDTETVSLGRFHIGATNLTGTLTLSNTATADGFSESLQVTGASTTGSATVGSTPAGLIAAGANATITVGIGSVSAVGANSGNVVLGLASNGTGTSGLSALSLGNRTILVTAQGYSGQAIWNRNTGGNWNDFASWDEPGGKPGVDGELSVNDTATFGAGPSSAATVSLNGSSPVLTALTFNNATAPYTIAPGTDGSITLGTAQHAATITNSAGNHNVATGLELARATTVTSAAGSRLTVSGVISGANALTKTGAGTLVLSGANTYTGATTVSAGLLSVNGSIASSEVTVQNGGTLGGSGTVGATTIQSGGTLSPGNSPGILTASDGLTLAEGSTFVWELIGNTSSGRGTNYDGVDVTGGMLTIADFVRADLRFNTEGSTVRWLDAFWASDRTWQVFSNANVPTFGSELIFRFTDVSVDSEGSTLNQVAGREYAAFRWRTDGNDVFLDYVAVIPEPSSFAILAAFGALGHAALRRRRRA